MRVGRIACVTASTIGLGLLVACGGGGGSGNQGICVDPRVVRDSSSPHRLSYECAVLDDGQRSFFLAGAGGPEGFLYLSDARKDAIVDKPAAEGGNAIYFESIRSHGGDGAGSENPFLGGDPSRGIDDRILDEWETTFERMDDAGIALFFFLYDDGAQPFGCAVPLSAAEREYISTIVTRFREHRHLIWMTQEEFQNGGCADSAARQRAIAALIRANDPAHAVGTHHMNGQTMQFGGDSNIRIYAQQAGRGTWAGVANMHDSAGKAGWGNWVYVMAEAHPWHRDLLAGGNANRAIIRQSMWATAMAGGYVMLYDAFESG